MPAEAGLAGAFVGVFHANSIGLTGPGFGFEAAALTGSRAMRAYLSGQNIALGIVAVPLLTLASFGIAAVAGHPLDGFLGAAVDFAALGAGLALSNTSPPGWPTRWKNGPATPRRGPPTGRTATRSGRLGLLGRHWLSVDPARWTAMGLGWAEDTT